ncbi:LORF2 protein, partial [Crocuta crocuta]
KKWANYLNRCFSKEGKYTANKHIKRCSTSLDIREMEITTTLRYCFNPTKTVNIKATRMNNRKCWQGCGEIGILVLSKSIFFLESKVSFLLLRHRSTGTPMFIAALSTIAKTWKEPKCPSTDEWIKKM